MSFKGAGAYQSDMPFFTFFRCNCIQQYLFLPKSEYVSIMLFLYKSRKYHFKIINGKEYLRYDRWNKWTAYGQYAVNED